MPEPEIKEKENLSTEEVVEEEVGDMVKDYFPQTTPKEEEPPKKDEEEEAPEEEPSEEEVPQEEEEEEEKPKKEEEEEEVEEEEHEEEPSEEEKPKEAEEKDEEPEEEEPKDKEASANEVLRAQLESLAAIAQGAKPAEPPVKEEPPAKEEGEEEPEAKAVPVELPEKGVQNLYEFVTEEQAEELGIDKAFINKLGNQIYQLAVRNTLLTIPKAVKAEVRDEVNVMTLAKEFYKANPDLAKYKQFVGFTANQIASKNPDVSQEDLFKVLGKEARKGLGLPEVSVEKPAEERAEEAPRNGGKKKPAFVKRPSSKRHVAEQLTGLEKEISDLIE